MSRLDSMARFEEHPALPEPPFFEFEDLDSHIRRPRREHCTIDPPEYISLCLNCKRPSCTNCLEKRLSKRQHPARCKKAKTARFDRKAHDA